MTENAQDVVAASAAVSATADVNTVKLDEIKVLADA